MASPEIGSASNGVIKDIFKAVRAGDEGAWRRAYSQTHEGEPLRQSIDHVISLDSQYREKPREH